MGFQVHPALWPGSRIVRALHRVSESAHGVPWRRLIGLRDARQAVQAS